MTVNQLILAMLGEVVFLLLLWLIYSVIRIRKLKKSKSSKVVVKEVAKEPREEVEIPTYLTFLSQAMLATELRMEEGGGAVDSADDSFDLGGDFSNPLELRMAFIRSEIGAIEASGEDGSAYWKSQEQSLKEILESIPSVVKETEAKVDEPEASLEGEPVKAIDSSETEAIRTELNALKVQAQSLEQYKTLFYGLAGKLKDATEAVRPITEQLESVKTQMEDSAVIDVLASSYENEYNQLQSLLDDIGDGELDEVTLEKLKKMLEMRTKRPKEKVVYVDKAEYKVRKEVDKLKSVSDQQENIISELQGMLEMSEDEGMKGEFLSRINALEAALSESKMCIEVLENENQSRQEQLEDLLITLDDLTARAERAAELEEGMVTDATVAEDDAEIDPDDLLAEVQQQTQTVTAATDDVVELEREKLALKRKLAAIEEEQQELTKELEQKQSKVDELEKIISRFSRESGDVMNAVVTLEDENNRLIDEVDKIKLEKQELENRLGEEPLDEEDSVEQVVGDDDIDALLASANDILAGVEDSAVDGSSEENAGMGKKEFEQVSQQIDSDINIELAELEEQNQGLNDELLKSKGQLDTKQEELEKALEEFARKEQEHSSLGKLLDEKDESLKQRQQELELAQKDLQILKEEVHDKDVQYERLKKEFTEMEKSLAGEM